MNSYAIDLSAGGIGFDANSKVALRKALGYAVLFGANLSFTPLFLQASDNPKLVSVSNPLDTRYPSILSFDLDFSLSNIPSFFDKDNVTTESLLGIQTVYDTACQAVREYIDKPYAVKGLMAVVTAASDPSADMDGYVSFSYLDHNGGGGPQVRTVYIGTVNSSATDFYTPFASNAGEVTFIDPQATLKAARGKDTSVGANFTRNGR